MSSTTTEKYGTTVLSKRVNVLWQERWESGTLLAADSDRRISPLLPQAPEFIRVRYQQRSKEQVKARVEAADNSAAGGNPILPAPPGQQQQQGKIYVHKGRAENHSDRFAAAVAGNLTPLKDMIDLCAMYGTGFTEKGEELVKEMADVLYSDPLENSQSKNTESPSTFIIVAHQKKRYLIHPCRCTEAACRCQKRLIVGVKPFTDGAVESIGSGGDQASVFWMENEKHYKEPSSWPFGGLPRFKLEKLEKFTEAIFDYVAKKDPHTSPEYNGCVLFDDTKIDPYVWPKAAWSSSSVAFKS